MDRRERPVDLTPAGTSITNRATVNYSVGGQAKRSIESSPTGNTTPGVNAGASTTFVVDNRVDLTVAELRAARRSRRRARPMQRSRSRLRTPVTRRKGYRLTLTEEVGTALFGNTDNADSLGNCVVRVDEDPSAAEGTGNDTFDGTETATAIEVLNPATSVTVFVVSPTVPLTLVNANFANANLQAQTAVDRHERRHARGRRRLGVNYRTTVEIVFADAGNDATQSATTSSRSDRRASRSRRRRPSSTTASAARARERIPGAVVEYVITIANSEHHDGRRRSRISDPIPSATTFQTGSIPARAPSRSRAASAATCIERRRRREPRRLFRNGAARSRRRHGARQHRRRRVATVRFASGSSDRIDSIAI